MKNYPLTKSIGYLGLGLAIRVFSGFVVFVVLAKYLGAENFGRLMLLISSATICTMFSTLGLNTYVLKESSEAKNQLNEIFDECFQAKIMLSSIVFLSSSVAVFIGTEIELFLWALLISAVIFDSLTEYNNIYFRANNKENIELKITAISSLIHITFTIPSAVVTEDINYVALSYFCSKLISLLISTRKINSRTIKMSVRDIPLTMRHIRSSLHYTLEYFTQTISGNLDNLIIGGMLGPASVGIYQAGMRFFLVLSQSASILSNALLPRLIRSKPDASEWKKTKKTTYIIFSSSGFFGLFIFSLDAKYFIATFIGSSYAELADLFHLFGILFLVRFFAASHGLVLTASSHQNYKAKAGLISLLFLLVAGPFLVKAHELHGWLYTLIISSSLLLMLYIFKQKA